MQRPASVTVAVILTILSGAATVVGTIVAYVESEVHYVFSPQVAEGLRAAIVAEGGSGAVADDIGPVVAVALVLVIAVAVLMIWTATEVWRGHAWARNTLTTLLVLDLLAGLTAIVSDADATRWNDLPTVAADLVVLWLLWGGAAREYFAAATLERFATRGR